MPNFWWKTPFENDVTEMFFDADSNEMKMLLKGPEGLRMDLDGNMYKSFREGTMTSLSDFDLNFIIDPDRFQK